MGRTKALFVLLLAIGGALFPIPFQFAKAAPVVHHTRADKTPVIRKISATSDRLEGGAQVEIKGKNFTPDTVVVIGDAVATDVQVINGKTIRFTVPPQKAPGVRTLSVWAPNGVAQIPFQIVPKKLGELADGEITTIAGGVEYVEDGERMSNACFSFPTYITGDSVGNFYVSDTFHHRIRHMNRKTGVVTTIVGNGRRGFTGDGGMALSASIAFPGDMIVTSDHKLIFVDAGNARIRQVNLKTGLITTVAGTGIEGFSGDGSLATSAQFSLAIFNYTVSGGIALDRLGNLYVADINNNRIRRIEHTTGIITTFAGTGQPTGDLGDGGPAIQANLQHPIGITLDLSGNVLIAENYRIRRVDVQTGIIATIAGTGDPGFGGDGGPATQAGIAARQVKVDSDGNIFLVERSYYRIRRIDVRTNIIQTIAGNGTKGNASTPGEQLATETGIGILYGGGIFASSPSEVWITESQWNRISRVTLQTGLISTRAGGKPIENGDNGPALKARLLVSDIVNQVVLSKPADIAVSYRGEVVVLAEMAYHQIRKIDLTTGIITTLAGTGAEGYNGDGLRAEKTMFAQPDNLIFDQNENILITDRGNNRIRKVNGRTNIVTTIAGNGARELNGEYDEDDDQFYFLDDNGPATEASIAGPGGIALDGDGNLFISHFGLFVRRVAAQTQIITTRLGCCRVAIPGLLGITIGGSGNLYLATNVELFKLEPNSTDLKKIFNRSSLVDLTVSQQEFLFISTLEGNSIFKTDPTGSSTILISGGKPGYEGDNGPATEAAFSAPSSVAIDGANNLYIVDSGNHAVRVIKNGAR